MRQSTILIMMMIAVACGDAGRGPDTIEPPGNTALCCVTDDGCYHGVESEGDCELFAGTVGTPGSVCDGASATCRPPPASPGQCCQIPDAGVCLAGPSLNLEACVAAGGIDFPSGARCLPDATCSIAAP